MPDEIKDDLETILADLREAFDNAENGVATLTTHVGAKFQARVERVSAWLFDQP